MKRKINISQSTFSRPDDWKCASRATSNESINWLEFKRNYHFLLHSICSYAGWRRYGCWELKLFQSFGMQVYCHWHNFLSLLNKQQKKSFSSTASDWNNLSERFDWVFRLIGIIFKYSDCTFFYWYSISYSNVQNVQCICSAAICSRSRQSQVDGSRLFDAIEYTINLHLIDSFY